MPNQAACVFECLEDTLQTRGAILEEIGQKKHVIKFHSKLDGKKNMQNLILIIFLLDL